MLGEEPQPKMHFFLCVGWQYSYLRFKTKLIQFCLCWGLSKKKNTKNRKKENTIKEGQKGQKRQIQLKQTHY